MNLDTYKNYLISYYYHECDNNDVKREERNNAINKRYSNEFLLKIIENTKDVFQTLLTTMHESGNFYQDNIFYSLHYFDDNRISSNCTGGWCPDIIINLDYEKKQCISLYLLRQLFGISFHIYHDYDEIEYYNEEEDSGDLNVIPKLYITGKIQAFDLIYQQQLQKRLGKALHCQSLKLESKQSK